MHWKENTGTSSAPGARRLVLRGQVSRPLPQHRALPGGRVWSSRVITSCHVWAFCDAVPYFFRTSSDVCADRAGHQEAHVLEVIPSGAQRPIHLTSDRRPIAITALRFMCFLYHDEALGLGAVRVQGVTVLGPGLLPDACLIQLHERFRG